jgi:hypothetical protein
MPKNIIVFSDGTGQAGGITFDEVRTNVYKLYRACRVGPDTTIEPSEQVAFYDPGLGSPADGSKIKIQWARKIYNLASMATGLGITANIIDCYPALIRLYRDGDRIFLIGFSRGAYTVASLLLILLQFRQQTRSRRRICGVLSFHELLEDWLQQCSAVPRFAATGPQPGQVDGGAQLPCACALLAAQFKRLHKARFCIFDRDARRRAKQISLHP